MVCKKNFQSSLLEFLAVLDLSREKITWSHSNSTNLHFYPELTSALMSTDIKYLYALDGSFWTVVDWSKFPALVWNFGYRIPT